MTSTIKVNNIQNQCGANIINESSNTITIGASGDTIALASGASQTGFGRTGTVNWDTTAKTASFTAVSGNGYFVNTTSAAITVTLPAGSSGDIVAFKDYANTWDTNNVTLTPNGTDKINGANANATLSTESQSVTIIYVDSTKGWQDIHDSTSNVTGSAYVAATGGTVLTSGNFKTHIFTSPGTFCVSCAGNACGSNTVDYFVVAGGGGGGRDDFPACRVGAGGGAGGFRLSNSVGCLPAPSMSPLSNPTGLPVSVTGYPITVGAGGNGGTSSDQGGARGSNSIFSTITSTGGGGGGGHTPTSDTPSALFPGGSGGGSQGTGGTGNTPPVSPPQGNNAGNGGAAPSYAGGGGGGAGAVGGNQSGSTGGSGGDGSFIACSMIGPTAPSYGTPGPATGRYFAGGGGAKESGAGGAGGGAAASGGANATVNTGGGGGGQRAGNAGSGGSGIVIIRYRFQ